MSDSMTEYSGKKHMRFGALLVKRYNQWTGEIFKMWLFHLGSQHCSGRNTFILGGRIITGSHGSQLFTTAVLLVVTYSLFLGLIVPFLHTPVLYPMSIILLTITFVYLCLTAFTDPGIIPRNLSPYSVKSSVEVGVTDHCAICNINRPLRAKHCRYCDNCVEVMDHHCPVSSRCFTLF